MDRKYEARFYQQAKDLEGVLCGGMASRKTMKAFKELFACIGEEIQSPFLKLQVEEEVNEWNKTLAHLDNVSPEV